MTSSRFVPGISPVAFPGCPYFDDLGPGGEVADVLVGFGDGAATYRIGDRIGRDESLFATS